MEGGVVCWSLILISIRDTIHSQANYVNVATCDAEVNCYRRDAFFVSPVKNT